MITIYILLILIIFISVLMVIEKNNLNLIIYSSVFSLIAASLYYRYKSPDLALAEVAIGSAILPLIFIIAISKQRTFLVVSEVDDAFFHTVKGVKKGRGFKLINAFCKDHDLKLKIIHTKNKEELNFFDKKNIDVIVRRCPSANKYILRGNLSSILIQALKKLTENMNDVEVIEIEELEREIPENYYDISA